MNLEEDKTDISYFTCSLSSLLGFWAVWGPFRFCFFSVFFPSPLLKKTLKTLKKHRKNPERLPRKPRRDENEQVKCVLTVLFSPKFIFNLVLDCLCHFWDMNWFLHCLLLYFTDQSRLLTCLAHSYCSVRVSANFLFYSYLWQLFILLQCSHKQCSVLSFHN